MDPVMRIVLPLIGAAVGAGIGGISSSLFATAVGAGIGYVLAELGLLHTTLRGLGMDLQRLQQRVERLRQELDDAAAPGVTESAATTLPAAEAEAEAVVKAVAPAPVAEPRVAQTPREPPRTQAERDEFPGIATLRSFFTGGNAVVRAGVIVVFFGVAFLLRYMAEHSHVPIEVRLSGVVLCGLALLVLGWRLRLKRPGYALALQGAAIGVLYLTIFAAFRLFDLLPPGWAFAALAAIAGLSAALAVLQNSQSFALLAVSGGFLAPVLASNGNGSHVDLFSYYAILNFGIVSMAWFKAWRPLNVAGFVFTFAIGTVWGVLEYQPAFFASTEPFLVLFFLMYFAVAILFSLRQPPDLRGYVDGTMVFGTPLAAFGLQSLLLHDRAMDLAFSALAASALYLGAAALLRRRGDDALQLLVDAFMALGVLFLTLAIPLALDQRWSALGWAFEGTALVWIGGRQDRVLARSCGALLNLAAGYFVTREFGSSLDHGWLAPQGFLAIVAVSGAAIVSASMMNRSREKLHDLESAVPSLLYAYGALWWVIAGLAQVDRYLPHHHAAAALGFLALTALASSELSRRTALAAAKVVALLLLPVLLSFATAAAFDRVHPFAQFGWIAWPFAFGCWYLILQRHEGEPRRTLAKSLQTVSMWLVCTILGWECGWAVDTWVNGSADWPLAAMVLPATAVLYSMPRLVTRIAWPFMRHRDVYLFVVGVGLALALCIWSLGASLFLGGDARPLGYLPLLNPVDLAQAAVLLGLVRYTRWLRSVRSPGYSRLDPRLPYPGIVALTFVWLNAVLLRTLHHLGGIPYAFDAMFASTLVQTCVSIFWALAALGAMVLAGRRTSRPIWIAGAALMGVVIGKLFLIDLSRVGSIERIVSFLGVGGLMLIVGYLSPLPPAVSKDEK